MNNEYPNWNLWNHITIMIAVMSDMMGGAKDFWMWLAALFAGVLFGLAIIPVSILWFIIKNKGQVGVLTWAALPITVLIGFFWMALA